MNFNALFSLFIKVFGTYETDKAIIDSGATASTPALQIGTNNGEPLYARVQLSCDPNFSNVVPSSNASVNAAAAAAKT